MDVIQGMLNGVNPSTASLLQLDFFSHASTMQQNLNFFGLFLLWFGGGGGCCCFLVRLQDLSYGYPWCISDFLVILQSIALLHIY